MGLYERITDKNSLKKAWDKIKGNNEIGRAHV